MRIEMAPPIVARGVLVDAAAYHGVDTLLVATLSLALHGHRRDDGRDTSTRASMTGDVRPPTVRRTSSRCCLARSQA